MSVKNIIQEYEHVCAQIKRLSKELYDLKDRKKSIEKQLEEYLIQSKERGLSFGDTEISLEKVERKQRIGAKKKSESILKILNDHRVSNPESILSDIFQLGDTTERHILKVKKKIK